MIINYGRDILTTYRTTDTRESENITATGNSTYLSTQPLKDNSNIRIIKINADQAHLVAQKQHQQLVTQVQTTTTSTIASTLTNGCKNNNNNQSSTNYLTITNICNITAGIPTANSTNNTTKVTNNTSTDSGTNERPLKCLETLAQKAGITFDEKYDFAPSTPLNSTLPPAHSEVNLITNNTPTAVTSSNTYFGDGRKSFTLEKSQSPSQQVAPGTVPLQISPEQLQQLQHYHQLQQSSPFAAIQVKQEFPTQQHTLTGQGGNTTEIKHPGLLDAATQGQLQQMQMQLAQAAADVNSVGGPNSPANQHTPTSVGAVAAMQQQHSTTISAMSPMQLATATGQVTATGDWTQGRTVQLMQPSTGFIYPHMLVPGNLIQSGLGQQPIQVIAAGKPFQGGTPQMIATTQNAKQMAIGGNNGFPSGTTYAIPSSQSPQTLLFSPVNVISQTQQQQQHNILQAMTAAANAQQQQQQQQQKGAVDTQKGLQQKIVQKVTTTTNTVQSAANAVAAAQQQQQHATQQCVQVNTQSAGMPAGTTQILNPLQQATAQAQPLQINATPWVQSVPFWSNGLQQLAQNPIIIRGTQADGTPGVFIQQPSGQTLQTQQPNQITLQCNVTQTPSKQRTQLEQLAAAKQQQQQTVQNHAQQVVQQHQATSLQVHQQQQPQVNTAQQQQQAVVHAQLQQQAVVAAANQQRGQTQILPQSGSSLVRPASSVSTQTAQNQSLLKQKMRTKQQAVRPALPAMKTEPQTVQQVHQQQQQQIAKTNTVAGLQQQISAAVAAQQQQQSQPTMHQVVTSAGNKMVVMSAGTPITLQNGQTLQQAVDKQQQQQQFQLQQLQKQQQQYLQQQLIQQQLAQIQLQHQQQQQQAAVHQQQQQQLQQVVAAQQQQQVGQQTQQQQPQIQLQVGPQGFITTQQQQQLQNQLLQQQQHLQQQRDQQQSQNIIHQIVVQQSPQQQPAPQQQQQTQHLQQQLSGVPFSVSSSTPASIATSQALQNVAYQTKTSNTLPNTSVVTISNQNGPLVTSTVGLNQATAQLQQQQLIAATLAASQQQQHVVTVSQQQQPTVMPPPSSPAQNPILAMASMMNAATVSNIAGSNSLTTAVAMTLPMGNTSTTITNSLPATPNKTTLEQFKTVSSAPSTPTTATINVNLGASMQSTTLQQITAEPISNDSATISNDNKAIESPTTTTAMNSSSSTINSTLVAISNIATTTTTITTTSTPPCLQLTSAVFTATETPQMAVQPMDTSEGLNETLQANKTSVANKQANSSVVASSNLLTECIKSSCKSQKTSNTPQSVANESEQLCTQMSSVFSSSPDESSCLPATSTTSTSCITSVNTTSSHTTTSSTFSTSITTSSTSSSTSVNTKISGPPPKSTPGATIVKVEKDLPKAMIKPNVLTHVIDGFIIQEANEPFPVTRKRYTDKDDNDELPQKKQALDATTHHINSNNMPSTPLTGDMVACEQCGKPEHKTKLKKKRFCSPVCARLAKASVSELVAQAQQHQQQHQQNHQHIQQTDIISDSNINSNDCNSSNHLNNSIGAGSLVDRMQTDNIIMQNLGTVTTALQPQMPQPSTLTSSANSLPTVGNETSPLAPVMPTAPAIEQLPQMANWTVSDVCEFIKNLPGCTDYVDDFEQQEIDGQALLLLKENHLVNAMGMKLGPALKIVAKVESMKEVSAASLNTANNAVEVNNATLQ